MSVGPVKLIYIAGGSRSGSTLLSNILGEIDGVFNAGEVIDIWDRGITWDGHCGCAEPFSRCRFWQEVLHEAFGGPDRVDVDEMIRLRDRYAHSWRVPWRMIMPGARGWLERRLERALEELENLYRAIQSTSGSKVIVDSSKNAGYGQVLSMVKGIDLYNVHLLRDPRATAYSWLRRKEGLWQTNPVKSSIEWGVRNVVTEILGRGCREKYLRVHYETLVSRPRETVGEILELLGEEKRELSFIEETGVRLGANHCIYGNPDRFKRGTIPLRLDDEWKGMKKSDMMTVTALTWPLIFRYGYPLRAS